MERNMSQFRLSTAAPIFLPHSLHVSCFPPVPLCTYGVARLSWHYIHTDAGDQVKERVKAFSLCLKKLSLIPSSLNPHISTHIFFSSYILLMRLPQSTYWLESAGSHGVWGLSDDHHFLPRWGTGLFVQGRSTMRRL
ncbi:hypothetical protein DFP72DRAFT_889643 [Ephemerocybe angulata]|uniref:Serine/threonine-protein phosphatase 2A activator n=1 Tax=Ephemerocybe angulata TaxID=980116 RepID=A0A8H6I329_9AGAR|nr:hypothetical protein DFP72DRAFT_889643 [Tulosesus angulatus]